MPVRRHLAAAAVAAALAGGLTACSDDDDGAVDTPEPAVTESVAPGTREEGVPQTPLTEGEPPADDVTVDPTQSPG